MVREREVVLSVLAPLKQQKQPRSPNGLALVSYKHVAHIETIAACIAFLTEGLPAMYAETLAGMRDHQRQFPGDRRNNAKLASLEADLASAVRLVALLPPVPARLSN